LRAPGIVHPPSPWEGEGWRRGRSGGGGSAFRYRYRCAFFPAGDRLTFAARAGRAGRVRRAPAAERGAAFRFVLGAAVRLRPAVSPPVATAAGMAGAAGASVSPVGTRSGLENLSTWAHELVHAAADRRGTLVGGRGQKLSNEVVAEFGGAILLECLGHSVESDRGGAYAYIESYCREHKADLLTACTEFLDRACAAVALLLDATQEISSPAVSAA